MAKLLKRYTSLANALDTLKNERLTLLDPATWKDKNDTRFMEAYREKSGYKKIYAACFSHVGEAYHHWEVFARHNEGVCIEIFRDELISSLSEKDGYVFRDVEYYNLTQLSKMHSILDVDLPFMKGDGYRPEQEFRLIYGDRNGRFPVHHLVCPRKFVNRIIINPWIPHGLVPAVKDALRSAIGAREPRIEVSSFIDNEQWAKAVNNVTDFESLLG